MQGDRMRRIDEAVREVVSNALTGASEDERLGFVTVTGVDTSPDLRHAVVFVSVFESADRRDDSLAVLEELRAELQTEIATHLRIKNTPILRFELDDSVDRGMRVTELINEEAAAMGEQTDSTED